MQHCNFILFLTFPINHYFVDSNFKAIFSSILMIEMILKENLYLDEIVCRVTKLTKRFLHVCVTDTILMETR